MPTRVPGLRLQDLSGPTYVSIHPLHLVHT